MGWPRYNIELYPTQSVKTPPPMGWPRYNIELYPLQSVKTPPDGWPRYNIELYLSKSVKTPPMSDLIITLNCIPCKALRPLRWVT